MHPRLLDCTEIRDVLPFDSGKSVFVIFFKTTPLFCSRNGSNCWYGDLIKLFDIAFDDHMLQKEVSGKTKKLSLLH